MASASAKDDATQKLVDGASLIATLDALEPRSVVMDGAGEVWRKLGNGRWDCLDAAGDAPAEDASVVVWQSSPPAMSVLWTPTLEAAQRPPVSPEVREEIAAVLFDADEHHDGTEAEFRNDAHTIGGVHHRASARAQADAILARFSVPSQPVYDEEKIARWIQNVRDAEYGIGAGREPSGTSRRDAAALIAALPSLTVTVGDGTSSDSEAEENR